MPQPERIINPLPPGTNSTSLLTELQNKQLITKLRDAEAYMDAGGVNSKEKTLKIYNNVLEQLSPEAYHELNQKLLGQANKEALDGHIDDALAKYRAIFAATMQHR